MELFGNECTRVLSDVHKQCARKKRGGMLLNVNARRLRFLSVHDIY